MKYLFVLVCFLLSLLPALCEYYDAPYTIYIDRDEGLTSSPELVRRDFEGNIYFINIANITKINPENGVVEQIDSLKFGDSAFKLRFITPRNVQFGNKSLCFRFWSGNHGSLVEDSSYTGIMMQDTSFLFEEEMFSSRYLPKSSVFYSNNKYYFAGAWDYLYSFDETTFVLDSLPVDSVSMFQWSMSCNSFTPYKDGFVYLTQFDQQLKYYSTTEKWSYNLDSLGKSTSGLWNNISSFDYYDGKILLGNKYSAFFIFDIVTHELEAIDLSNTIVADECKDMVDFEDNLTLNAELMFGCDGNIYITINNREFGINRVYQMDSVGVIKHYDIDFIDRVIFVQRSNTNSHWISGISKDTSERKVLVFEYFPDDTSIEAFPTIVPINVYPNPATTYTNVKFYLKPSTMSKIKFKIYNYMGQLIKELDNEMEYDESTAFAVKRINTLNMKTGMYYLLVDNDAQKRLFGFAVN